jgi:hypothetical protein
VNHETHERSRKTRKVFVHFVSFVPFVFQTALDNSAASTIQAAVRPAVRSRAPGGASLLKPVIPGVSRSIEKVLELSKTYESRSH